MFHSLLPFHWILLQACGPDAVGDKGPNDAPENLELIVQPVDGSPTNGQVVCIATASDPNGDPLAITLQWTNITTGQDLGNDSLLQLNNELVTPGDTLQCDVTFDDQRGEVISGSGTVDIVNSLPKIADLTVTPGSDVRTNSELSCLADVTDIDGGTPTIEYTWNRGEEELASGDSLALSPTNYAVDETITCLASVTDEHGGAANLDQSVVIDNTPPSVIQVSLEPDSDVVYDSVLTCSGMALDADLQEFTLSYQWSLDGVDLEEESDTLDLSTLEAKPGSVAKCTLIATDESGDTGTNFAQVTVQNSEPSFTATATIIPEEAHTGTLLTCSAEADDPNDGPLVPSYLWTNQLGDTLSTNDTYTPTLDDSVGDVFTCTATATDADGGQITSSAAIVLFNSDPHIDSALIGSVPVSGDTVECSAIDVEDIDGDSVTLTYRWSIDSIEVAITEDTTELIDTLDSSIELHAGEEITCEITPNDGTSDGGVVVDFVVVANTPPILDSVSLSPTDATSSTTLLAEFSATDPDEQAISVVYTWNISIDDGTTWTIVAGEESDTLNTEFYEKDNMVMASAVVSDGIDTTTSMDSNSITVLNSPPVIDSISFVTDEITGDVQCAVEASDFDDDDMVIDLVWTADDEAWTGETGDDGDTITSSDFLQYLNWNCTATVTDEDDESTTESISSNLDLDNDGVEDAFECEPDDANVVTLIEDDTDCDGQLNDDDICADSDDTVDTDADSVPDGCDICEGSDDSTDEDGDSIPDGCDNFLNDSDNDGVANDLDACADFDDAQDEDLDDIPDGCDSFLDDSDNDGVINDSDLCDGFDDNLDEDLDGIADGCDNFLDDSDNDGVVNGSDVCEGSDDAIDTDNDTVPDGCDSCEGSDDAADEDADGIADGCDSSLDDSDNDGVVNGSDVCEGSDDGIDSDNDTVPDGCDTCEGSDDTADEDSDAIPDGCDSFLDDSDNDGVVNGSDTCAGFDDAADEDLDGIADGCDDFLDDSDNDGVVNASDICEGADDTFDDDNDSIPDGCDVCDGFDDALDDDNDSTPNGCDVCDDFDDAIDEDSDGIPDGCDTFLDDSDNDGVVNGSDICAGHDDAIDDDGDTIPDGCDTFLDDTDNDGVVNASDLCAGSDDSADEDSDGIPDGCDSFLDDSDNDGVVNGSDVCEGSNDSLDDDGDTIPDGCDVCAGFDDTIDADNDLVPDDCDVCAGFDDAIDEDIDAIPDGCDSFLDDSDNDGVVNGSDICDGSDDSIDDDADTVPDGCDVCVGFDDTIDADSDLVPDGCDACEGFDDAVDEDRDAIPDGCDTFLDDTDNDGVVNASDICEGADDSIDGDTDSVPDGCDVCAGFDDAVDEDSDGIPDGCDSFLDDTDNDGVVNASDICAGFDDTADEDSDGIPDGCDSFLDDTDNDGVVNASDICEGADDSIDGDTDSVPDGCDVCAGFDDAVDEDSDGIPDGCDSFLDDTATEPSAEPSNEPSQETSFDDSSPFTVLSKTFFSDGGGYVDIDLMLSSEASGVMITLQTDHWPALIEVVDPMGNVVLNRADWISNPQGLTEAVFANHQDVFFNWPVRIEDGPLFEGSWRFTFYLWNNAGNAQTNTSVDATILMKQDNNFSQGEVTATIVYAQGLFNDTDLTNAVNDAIEVWRDLFYQWGIDLTVLSSSSNLSTQLPNPAAGDPVFMGLSSSDRDVLLVIGEGINSYPGWLGMTGAIPCTTVDGERAAIAIDWLSNAGTDSVFSSTEVRMFGETLAHEVGHFMGLLHPVETSWNMWDALSDTSNCANQSICESEYDDNLMFPYPVCSSSDCITQDVLTTEQTGVLHRHIAME